MSEQDKEKTYYQQRMELLGINEENNRITLKDPDAEFPATGIVQTEIFTEDQDGNIEILVYTIEGEMITYDKGTSKTQYKSKKYQVKRLKTPFINKKGEVQKYEYPKGHGTRPFFPPPLLQAYKEKKKIKSLVLTEGYFKAFKGAMHDLDVVGISSITTYRDKESRELHSDVQKLIKATNPDCFILLYDGDCRNFSEKAVSKGKDLRYRLNTFFNSARGMAESLKDYDRPIYFAHVLSENLIAEATGESPKGLDDLLCAYPDSTAEIKDDLCQVSKPGRYFHKIEITYSLAPLQSYLKLNSARDFYDHHNQQIGERDFIWGGTKYKWNPERSELEVMIPGEAKNYFRVGDQYYEWVEIPNKYSQRERTYHKRQKSTITDDYGKAFTKHIPKLKAFCNVPDHVNYQPIIDGCMNMYAPFEIEPSEGEHDLTLDFLRHIFGPHLELGLDYIQLLYKEPTQILPILCLVSKENSTGKSTFAKWLKAIFTQNMAIIGNAELTNDFNGSYASKLIACCEESFIEKRMVLEKIKALSTSDKITLNKKGKDHEEIDFFAKFLLLSNNEDDFVRAGEEDIRYWVLKVPVIPKEKKNPDLLVQMFDEIPAFLHFLNKRKLTTEKKDRAWFDPDLLKTEALERVIRNSRPTVEKEIREKVCQYFLDYPEDVLMMTLSDIKHRFCLSKYEDNYISKILRENLKVEHFHEINEKGEKVMKVKKYQFYITENAHDQEKKQIVASRVVVKGCGRPFVFYKKDFLTEAESNAIEYDPELIMVLSGAAIEKPVNGQIALTHNEPEEDLPF